jgi:hypothetical protein
MVEIQRCYIIMLSKISTFFSYIDAKTTNPLQFYPENMKKSHNFQN